MARSKGTGHIDKTPREDGTWRGYLTLDGKRAYFYGASPRDVEEQIILAKRAHDEGTFTHPNRQTVNAYFDQWLETKAGKVRFGTLKNYRLRLGHVRPLLGALKLRALRPFHIERCWTGMRTAGKTETEIAATHEVLSIALGQAWKWELIPRNPALAVDAPRRTPVPEHYLTESQVAQLLEANRFDRLYALWYLLLATGLRSSEALGLRWADLDDEHRQLFVHCQLVHVPDEGRYYFGPLKHEKQRRTLEIGSGVAETLGAHRDMQKRERKEREKRGLVVEDHDLMFPTPAGRPLHRSAAYKYFQEALQRAGLPRFRVHDLRHTTATQLLRAGVAMKLVQTQLGHATIGMTMDLYSHVSQDQMGEVARVMDGLLSGQTEARTAPKGV